MIDLDKHIDKYINDEKKITPSPFLQSRIMTSLNADIPPHRFTLWQPIAVSASIAAMVVSGFLIGSSYTQPANENNYMVVNDSHIETFLILIEDADQ